jgi:hypothetical protein
VSQLSPTAAVTAGPPWTRRTGWPEFVCCSAVRVVTALGLATAETRPGPRCRDRRLLKHQRNGRRRDRMRGRSKCGIRTRRPKERWRMSLSVHSRDSVLSLFSDGSVLSIGSTGSALSIGSVGSIASAFSIGSAGSIGSIFSAGSIAAVASAGGNGHVLGKRPKWREIGTIAGTLAGLTAALVIRRAVQ